MDWGFFIPLIIIGIFLLISITSSIKKKKKRMHAKKIFSETGGTNTQQEAIILNGHQGSQIISYLSGIYNNSPDNRNIIIECGDGASYVQFDPFNKRIRVLYSNEGNTSPPHEYSYKDFTKVALAHRTYSETRGSGKNRSTYYYNHYYTKLVGDHTIEVHNKRTQVSLDKGLEESQSRAIGEILAKILEIDLQRINNEVVPYTDLDISITEKLKDFQKAEIVVPRQNCVVLDIPDGFAIYKYLYYNTGLMVFGIIFTVLLGIGFAIFSANMYGLWMIALVVITAILLIVLIVRGCKYQIPKTRPVIYIYSDRILINIKARNQQVVKSESVDPTVIEDVEVRFEKGSGYAVRLVGDQIIKNAGRFRSNEQALWVREELLESLKKIKEGLFY